MADAAAPGSFLSRNDFLIRRLHSLSGLVPIGAYMVIHLATNATVWQPQQFQARVDQIHSLGFLLPAVEWTFIFLPLLFHMVIGVALIRGSHPNTTNYPYAGNVRYFLQRVTAWIALAFILWHVFEMHGWIKPLAEDLNGAKFRHLYATSSAAAAVKSSPVNIAFYFVGVLACVYHLANGIWTSGITWGLWTTKAAQRRANYVCAGAGAVLLSVAMAAYFGMLSVNVEKAFEMEKQINAHKLADGEITEAEAEDVPEFEKLPEGPAGEQQANAEPANDGSGKNSTKN